MIFVTEKGSVMRKSLYGMFFLSLIFSGFLFAADISITVNADKAVGEFYNFWSTSVVLDYDQFYPFSQQSKDRFIKENPSADYLNCVRFLGGRHDGKNNFFKGVDESGKAICDFDKAIRYIKGMKLFGMT